MERLNTGNGNKLSVGAYGSFELVINKLSMIIQPGWYLYREDWEVPEEPSEGISIPRRKPGDPYQRIGLKYHIFNNVFVGINVRAYNFYVADYIGWNIGYKVNWR